MFNRRTFGLTGLSAVALAAMESNVFAQAPAAAGHGHMEHDAMLQACAKACSDCQRMCDMCATHCAHQLAAGKQEHLTTLATCRDCADFCATAAEITARGGPFAALICQGCAEACARCAVECEKFPTDEHMKLCAQECRKCEKACKDMVGHAAQAK
jgi:hypothetical protein